MRIRGCSVIRTAMALAGTLSLATAAVAQPRLLTVAESSTFAATSRHEDVMTFVRTRSGRPQRLRVETLGTSAEGRQIPCS